MEYRQLGTRYKGIHKYDIIKHQPYDYRANGLLNKILPTVITNTTNKTTRLVLEFVESVQLFLLGYVDELKHFKNTHWKLH